MTTAPTIGGDTDALTPSRGGGMNHDEKLAATAVQLVEEKIRELRPQLIDAVTRGLCQVDRSHVAADVDEWLAEGPAVVRRAHEACWAAAEELSRADELYSAR